MTAIKTLDAVRDAQRIADTELASRPRLAHAALLAASLTMTVIVASLLLTEPGLPLHVRAALAVLTAIGAAWSGYAIWVLTARHVLFARQRVVAGWFALAFTSIFTAGATAIGFSNNAPSGLAAGALGTAGIAASAVLLTRARRRLAALIDHKCAIEASLSGGAE